MADKVTIFISTVSANQGMRSSISKAEMVLASKKIPYELIDITTVPGTKEQMRTIVNDPTALPIQFAKGDTYLGDFAAFEEAIEDEKVSTFCQME